MRTLQELKDETVSVLDYDFEGDDVCEVIDAFLDVIESHHGRLTFYDPPDDKPRVVQVEPAGEKGAAG